MKQGHKSKDIIKFNENIKLSKCRRPWFCAICHKPINSKDLSILIQDVLFYDNQFNASGFGVRIHQDCCKKLGKELDFFIKHKERYRLIGGFLDS